LELKNKTRLIVSNGFKYMLILFNTFSLRLSVDLKMMMMIFLNKSHFLLFVANICKLTVKFQIKSTKFTWEIIYLLIT
tara:strand:+ start:23560 stop:23793 length:234 start_codon:yes stop_codon:yes gene_type:complete